MATDKKKLIAEGSYGSVYRVKNQALKVVSNDYSSNSLRFNLRELSYLKLFTQLNAPSIIRIFDYDVTITISKFVINIYMPLADTTLKTFLERHDFDYRNYCLSNFTLQILNGVAFLESNKLMHGDLKPENILLFHNDDTIPRLKLCDLGLIINFNNISKQKLSSNEYGENYVCQTLGFQAPETIAVINQQDEFENKITISTKTDIWSIGMIIVSLLTGVSSYQFFQYDEKVIKYDAENNKKNIDEIVLGTYLDNLVGDDLDEFDDAYSQKYCHLEQQIETYSQLPIKTKFDWYSWVRDYQHQFGKVRDMIDNWERVSQHILIVLNKIFYLNPNQRYSASDLIPLLNPYHEIKYPQIESPSLRDLWLLEYLEQSKFDSNFLELRYKEIYRLYQYLNLTSYSDLHYLKQYWILTTEILDRYLLTLSNIEIKYYKRIDFKKLVLSSLAMALIFHGYLEKYHFTKYLIFFFYKNERELSTVVIQDIYQDIMRTSVKIYKALDTNLYHPEMTENMKLFASLEQFQQSQVVEKNKKLFGSIVVLNSTSI